jgi:hypothetical protein
MPAGDEIYYGPKEKEKRETAESKNILCHQRNLKRKK